MSEQAYENVKHQAGPCGIVCGTCPMGNGTSAEIAKKANEFINSEGIKDWMSSIPGGSEINWSEANKALDWVAKHAICPGCEQGGGPPYCEIKHCATSKDYQLCNECTEFVDCPKYEWLGEASKTLKAKLREGKTKEEYISESIP